MEEENLSFHQIDIGSPKRQWDVKEIIILVVVFLLVIGGGIFSGRFLAGKWGSFSGSGELAKGSVSQENIKKGEEFGLEDEQAFKDTAIGALKEGGVDGEGTHHLEREGGISQNVYLTSSVLDLHQFVDRKVQIWGETFAAQKAGWLMDVGKLKVLD